MTEFEGQVLGDLRVLKSQMDQLMGIGQVGRLTQIEERVERHERSVQRVKGLTEAMFGSGNGEQKRKAAVEIVGAAINITDAVTNKHIADAERFTAGLSAIIDGVVECLNASVWAKQASE